MYKVQIEEANLPGKILKGRVHSFKVMEFLLNLVRFVSMDFRLCFLCALQSVLIFFDVFAKLLSVILFAYFLYALLFVMVIPYCNVGSKCRLLNALTR